MWQGAWPLWSSPLPFIISPIHSRSILPVKGKQMATSTCTSSRKMIQNVSRIRIHRSKCLDRRENIMFAFHPWVFLYLDVLQALWSLKLWSSESDCERLNSSFLFNSWPGTHQENYAKRYRGWTDRCSCTGHHMYPIKTDLLGEVCISFKSISPLNIHTKLIALHSLAPSLSCTATEAYYSWLIWKSFYLLFLNIISVYLDFRVLFWYSLF